MATQKEIADHLFISTRRIRGLLKGGILPPRKGPGGLDLESFRKTYIDYLRGCGSRKIKIDEEEIKLDKARTLKVLEAYRKLKRENDLGDKTVAPVGLITDALAKTAVQIVPIMDALPLQMKRMNPGLTGHDIHIVKKAIAKCRNVMADAEIEL